MALLPLCPLTKKGWRPEGGVLGGTSKEYIDQESQGRSLPMYTFGVLSPNARSRPGPGFSWHMILSSSLARVFYLSFTSPKKKTSCVKTWTGANCFLEKYTVGRILLHFIFNFSFSFFFGEVGEVGEKESCPTIFPLKTVPGGKPPGRFARTQDFFAVRRRRKENRAPLHMKSQETTNP